MRKFAGWTGIVCAVHCCLAPLLVVVAPALALSETWEWVFLGAAVFLGCFSGVGFTLFGGTGLMVWLASLLGWLEIIHLPEVVTTTAGSLMFAFSMLRRHHHCGDE